MSEQGENRKFDIDEYCRKIIAKQDSVYSNKESKGYIDMFWKDDNDEKYEFRASEAEKYIYKDGQSNHVLIYGSAGSGKTWLLKKLLCSYCQKTLDTEAYDEKLIPVYVELKKYNDNKEKNENEKYVSSGDGTIVERLIEDEFKNADEAYSDVRFSDIKDKLLLLFDGYDEIYDEDDRDDFCDFLNEYGDDVKTVTANRRASASDIYPFEIEPEVYTSNHLTKEAIKEYMDFYVKENHKSIWTDAIDDDAKLSWMFKTSHNIMPVTLDMMAKTINKGKIEDLYQVDDFDRKFLLFLLRREKMKKKGEYIKRLNMLMKTIARRYVEIGGSEREEDLEAYLGISFKNGADARYITDAKVIPILEDTEDKKIDFVNPNYKKYYVEGLICEGDGTLKN
jgi:hypothetical protein